MKADLKAVINDYGFGSWTVAVSAIREDDGSPITNLQEKNFSIMAVQMPSGWATNQVLEIKSGIHKPTDGIYVFSAGLSGDKELAAGIYTLAITVGIRGFKGQTIVSGRIAK